MPFFYTYSLGTGARWNVSGRWSYTSDTRWNEDQYDFSLTYLIHELKILWYLFEQAKPIFLDNELAKTGLVGPTVVWRDSGVTGTLF